MGESIEMVLGQALRERGLTFAVAESCTGGLLGHRITNVPGSSEYFLGGVVAYAYEAKERLLGVEHNTLYEHGAVSRETALEMARGARSVFGADIGLSVTGIAGPGGGLPEKPVGLTWVAVSMREGEWAESYIFEGDRHANKAQSAEGAMALLHKILEGST
ncbi:MAG: CinA family protein [Anaerolineaceae bacterium]|nr:MAG: CinA family protein [Anaerolineaceae bacterium]